MGRTESYTGRILFLVTTNYWWAGWDPFIYGARLEATGERRPLPSPFEQRGTTTPKPPSAHGGAVRPRKSEVLSLVYSPSKPGVIFRPSFISLPVPPSLARALRMVAVTSLRPDRCVVLWVPQLSRSLMFMLTPVNSFVDLVVVQWADFSLRFVGSLNR